MNAHSDNQVPSGETRCGHVAAHVKAGTDKATPRLPLQEIQWDRLYVSEHGEPPTGTVAELSNCRKLVATFSVAECSDFPVRGWNPVLCWNIVVLGHDWQASASARTDRQHLDIHLKTPGVATTISWAAGHNLRHIPGIRDILSGRLIIDNNSANDIETIYDRKRARKITYRSSSGVIAETHLLGTGSPGKAAKHLIEVFRGRLPFSSLGWEANQVFSRVEQQRDPLIMCACAVVSIVSVSYLWRQL